MVVAESDGKAKGVEVGARSVKLVIVLVALVGVVASCGGDAEKATTTASTTTVTAATVDETTTTTIADDGSIKSLAEVRSAVVQILAEGSFVDPVEGQVSNVTGSGTGFIISPEGIAVTNNHVVTGAAFLQVLVDGHDDPLNAKVLGVSECSDLAVIDIDGDGFPYLNWYDGEATTGTSVYAAGFPLGDPEYTLTEGIVSKEKTSGETDWASVDTVLEHTAQILPGNSGGPLVAEDGSVVAVNYAGWNEYDLNFSIGRDEVFRALDTLQSGQDVTSIGVNGTAFVGDELSGIWVSAVDSGSPAARLGIVGGDIITEIEGLVMATDGTMADYCDILRSHDPDDPLAVKILRFETEEVLEGVLNEDDSLTLAFSFAEELGDEVAGSSATYAYMDVFDDDGLLYMQIPTAWSDVGGAAWEEEGRVVGNAIRAAPSLDGYYETWTTPGVFFGASAVLTQELEPGDLLNSTDFSGECFYDGTYDYEDAVYAGAYDVWVDCGGVGTTFVVLEAYPASLEFVALIQIQIVSDADLEALDTILATFDVTG